MPEKEFNSALFQNLFEQHANAQKETNIKLNQISREISDQKNQITELSVKQEQLHKDVNFLVEKVRDGNGDDSLITQIHNHDSRLSNLEEVLIDQKQSAKENHIWKKTTLVSILVALVGTFWSVFEALWVRK
jgi:hypothetical protein